MVITTAGQIPSPEEESLGPLDTKGCFSSSAAGASHPALSWDQQSLTRLGTVSLSFPWQEHEHRNHRTLRELWVQVHEWDKQMCSAHPTSSCTQDSVSPRNQHTSKRNKTHANISSRKQPKKAEVVGDTQGVGFAKSILYVTQKALQHWNFKGEKIISY